MGRTINGVNVCNILFDQKIQTFINKMKDEFINDFEIFNDCPYYI